MTASAIGLDLVSLVRDTPAQDLPALAGRLREAEFCFAELRLRDEERLSASSPSAAAGPDRWIMPEEAAGSRA